MNLSSHNRMVKQYFEALRRFVSRLATANHETELKQDVAIRIILAVTVVEAFLNLFFRVIVSEKAFAHHEQRVLDDLNKRRSLEYKLRTWPRVILGKNLDFSAPILKSFQSLKNRRNVLMHFTSSNQTLKLPRIKIRGLADTSAFDGLSAKDAENALEVAEGMVQELCRLRGLSEEQLDNALHLWTGKLPI